MTRAALSTVIFLVPGAALAHGAVGLPLSKPVEVTFVPTKAGKVHFACAMDMVSGDLQVE